MTTAIAVVSVCESESSHEADAAVVGDGTRLAGERERRLAAVGASHLDVAEFEVAQADAQGLHHRFLRREACREALGGVVLREPVLPLTVGEEALRQRGSPLQGEPEPPDLHEVGAQAHDHSGSVPERECGLECQRSASTYTGSVSRSTTSKSRASRRRTPASVSVTASFRRAVAALVALQDGPSDVGGEAVGDVHVQEREAHHLVALHLGHQEHGATVVPAARDRDLALGRDAVLRATERWIGQRCGTGIRRWCRRRAAWPHPRPDRPRCGSG